MFGFIYIFVVVGSALSHDYDHVVICCSGEGIVYHLDELTGALVISHKLVVSSKDFPGKC